MINKIWPQYRYSIMMVFGIIIFTALTFGFERMLFFIPHDLLYFDNAKYFFGFWISFFSIFCIALKYEKIQNEIRSLMINEKILKQRIFEYQYATILLNEYNKYNQKRKCVLDDNYVYEEMANLAEADNFRLSQFLVILKPNGLKYDKIIKETEELSELYDKFISRLNHYEYYADEIIVLKNHLLLDYLKTRIQEKKLKYKKQDNNFLIDFCNQLLSDHFETNKIKNEVSLVYFNPTPSCTDYRFVLSDKFIAFLKKEILKYNGHTNKIL